jgi:hypothetical protein
MSSVMNNEMQRAWKEAAVADLLSDPGVCLEGLRETTMRLAISLDTVCPSRDFNPKPSEFEVGVLTSRPQRNMWPTSQYAGLLERPGSEPRVISTLC